MEAWETVTVCIRTESMFATALIVIDLYRLTNLNQKILGTSQRKLRQGYF